MSKRINITGDLSGWRKLDLTMKGIMDAFTYTNEAYTHEVKAAVIAAGGRWKLKSDARKALLNKGVRIAVDQHREYTTWYLQPAMAVEAVTTRRSFSDAYSLQVSHARSLQADHDKAKAAGNMVLAADLYRWISVAQQVAFFLGGLLDPPKLPAEVLLDLQPI